MTHREWQAEVAKQLILQGMNRKQLAKQIERGYSYVTGVICGQIRSAKTVGLISEALGIEPYSE